MPAAIRKKRSDAIFCGVFLKLPGQRPGIQQHNGHRQNNEPCIEQQERAEEADEMPSLITRAGRHCRCVRAISAGLPVA